MDSVPINISKFFFGFVRLFVLAAKKEEGQNYSSDFFLIQNTF